MRTWKQVMVNPDELHSLPDNSIMVDVRSPSEFAKGHIPGAVNVPLFSDEERHVIGLTYRREGKEEAIHQGLTLVGPKLPNLSQSGQKLAKQGSLVVYCARGGMRSSSLCWLWNLVGINPVRISGGYKSYRKWVLSELQQTRPFIVISGKTGTGKTEVLLELAARGKNVIDLEGFANHRGSAFGDLGLPPQPSQQQFENLLATSLASTKPGQPIWIESESQLIGRLQVPKPMWLQMLNVPWMELNVPHEVRVARLLKEYGDFSPEELEKAVEKTKNRMGNEQFQMVVSLLRNGKLYETTKLLCSYYDKQYEKSSKKWRGRLPITTVKVGEKYDIQETAKQLIAEANKIANKKKQLNPTTSDFQRDQPEEYSALKGQ